VYCPHTAVDAAPGGLNDWLADGITTTEHEFVLGVGLYVDQGLASNRITKLIEVALEYKGWLTNVR
jgi:putative NIF3 family GTP cyclohydrolase 1 type 2